MSHDRTGKPVVCRDTSHEQGQEIQRQNTENEQSRRNSRPYWNCLSWRFTRRKADLIIAYWRRWWKEVWSRIYESRILKRETEIVTHDGQCSEVDSCSFRHDINKRAKNDTAESVSEFFFMQQDEKTRSPRGRMSLWKNVSMAMQGLRERNVHRLILKSGTLQNTCSTRLKSGGRLGEKCSHAHRQFDEQPSERSKRNYQ